MWKIFYFKGKRETARQKRTARQKTVIVMNATKKQSVIERRDCHTEINMAQIFYLKDIKETNYCQTKEACLQNAEALILLTEWKAFRSPNFNFIKQQLKNSIIFDGRNQYHSFKLEEMGFAYWQIGKKKINKKT